MSKEMSYGNRKDPDASKKARRAALADGRAKIRRDDAAERLAYWNRLAPDAQLKALDRRGVVATKQRERITTIIASNI
jgi:hypothetical protein